MEADGHESGRLAELYSSLSDAELQQIAQDPDALTDEAHITLSSELQRRGLTPLPHSSQANSTTEFRSLITIRRFRDLPEALLAKGSLESAGIECFLADDNMVRMDWFISNFIGGVKLQVWPEDAASAVEILDQPIPENFEAEGSGQYQQPKCPACQSLDVSFEELVKPIAYASAYFGLPLPIHRRAWRCHSCNREWEDLPDLDPLNKDHS